MKNLQSVLIAVLVFTCINAAEKWYDGKHVSAPYYFFSSLLSLIICVAVVILEIRMKKNTTPKQ